MTWSEAPRLLRLLVWALRLKPEFDVSTPRGPALAEAWTGTWQGATRRTTMDPELMQPAGRRIDPSTPEDTSEIDACTHEWGAEFSLHGQRAVRCQGRCRVLVLGGLLENLPEHGMNWSVASLVVPPPRAQG